MSRATNRPFGTTLLMLHLASVILCMVFALLLEDATAQSRYLVTELSNDITRVSAINNDGIVVGKKRTVGERCELVKWHQGDVQVLHRSLISNCNDSVLDINESGVAVGNIWKNGRYNAMLWSRSGAPTNFHEILGFHTNSDLSSTTRAINNRGQVVLYTFDHPYGPIRESYLLTPIDSSWNILRLPRIQERAFLPKDINDQGWIVGESAFEEQAFLYTPSGSFIPLISDPTIASSTAEAINEQGQVLGYRWAQEETGG